MRLGGYMSWVCPVDVLKLCPAAHRGERLLDIERWLCCRDCQRRRGLIEATPKVIKQNLASELI